MADEFKRFHSRLAELLALKKGDDYATTISWIRAKVSFSILPSSLLCLRGTRSKRRAANVSDIDIILILILCMTMVGFHDCLLRRDYTYNSVCITLLVLATRMFLRGAKVITKQAR